MARFTTMDLHNPLFNAGHDELYAILSNFYGREVDTAKEGVAKLYERNILLATWIMASAIQTYSKHGLYS